LDPLPVLLDYSSKEKKICELQTGFAARLRKSAYYVVETIKAKGQVGSLQRAPPGADKFMLDLERYSDKYRQSPASQPTLKRKDLHAPFFPPEIIEGYLNPRKKRKG
jgi:DNA-directed RNA polymerase III subunit RPC7